MIKTIGTNKIYLKSQILLLLVLIASSCLPVQKKTQCGDNEAFDGSKRKCVPVVGAASTGTVFITSRAPANSYTTTRVGSAVTHKISVSDVYAYGFNVKWYLHYTGTTTTSTLVATGVSQYSFVPATLYGFYGDGSYVVEAIVFDSTGEQLDSTSWSVTMNPFATPTFNSPSPAGAAFTYASNITTSTHQIDVSNPDSNSGTYVWYVDGVSVLTGALSGSTSETLTYNGFNPSLFSKGMHTIEVEMLDGASATYDSHVWTINIVDPDLPIVTSIYSYDDLMQTTPYDLVATGTVYAIDGEVYQAGGFHNNNTPTDEIMDICVTVDDYDKDNDGNADVALRVSINGTPIGGDSDFDDNVHCLSEIPATLPTQTLTIPQSTINKTLTFSMVNTSNTAVIETFPINLVVRPHNIAPTISIKHASTNPATNCDTTQIYNTTGCEQTQSLDADYDGDFTDGLPNVDNSNTYTINIYDPDETDVGSGFDVYFELKPAAGSYEQLDGTQTVTTSQAVDCVETTGVVSEYECNLDFAAFNLNGKIAPGVYVLQAYVEDTTLPYGGGTLTSNVVTWNITVSEYQSTGIYKTAITGIVGNDRDNDCSNVNGVQIQEGEYLNLQITIDDYDRDNIGSITLFLENQLAGLGTYSLLGTIPSPTITRTNPYDLSGTVEHCVLVPEWAVVGVERRDVGIQAVVTDSPDVTATATTSDIFSGTVTDVLNNNHLLFEPYFADASNVDLSADGHVVYSGYEYHIAPPTISDDSTYGGTNLVWKWQVALANSGVWTDIPQANSTDNPSSYDLYWTPDPGITASQVDLRICIGDDGYGNPADCTKAGLSKTYEDLRIEPNSAVLTGHGTATSDNTEVASWYDETEKYLYVAFANGTQVYVEKIDYSDPTLDSASRSKHVIRFEAENPNLGGTKVPSNIRLVGEDGAYLFVVYTVPSGSPGYNELRINRIHLDLNGTEAFGFGYDGLYSGTPTGQELFTSVTGDMAVSLNGVSDVDIQFHTTIPSGSSHTITFNDPFLGARNFVDGAGNQFCTGGADSCATYAQAAQSVYNNIMSTSTFYGGTVIAEWTSGNDTVTLRANPANSYIADSSVHAVKLGRPLLHGNNLFIPFIDGFRSNQISIYRVQSYNTANLTSSGLFGTLVTTTATNFTDIANTPDSAGSSTYIIGKGSDGNLDFYKFRLTDSTLEVASTRNDLIPSSISSTYNELYHIDISADASDNFMISGVTYNSVSDTYNLLAGALESTLTNNLFAISTFSNFVDIIDQAKIAADPNNDGEAIIAFTTADTANTEYGTRVIKVKATISGASVTAIQFPNEGDWVPPLINPAEPTLQNGAIAITPIYGVELGHPDDSANSTTYKTHNSIFLTYHEDDGGDGTGIGSSFIRQAVINIDTTSIPTTDDSTTYAYPPFVKNQ